MLVLTAVQAWFKLSSSLPSYLKQKVHFIALDLIPVALQWQDVLKLAWEENRKGCTKGILQPQHAIYPVVNSKYFLKYPMETTKNIKQKQHCKTRAILQLREILDIFYLICKYMSHFSSWCFKFTIVSFHIFENTQQTAILQWRIHDNLNFV